MSPAKHHRRRRLGGILAAGSALAIGIGVIIGNQVTGGGAVPPITGIPTNVGVANEWVNTTAGASPSRCSPACAYDSTHAYGSMGAANTAASAGDSVLFKAGTYMVTASGSPPVYPPQTVYTSQNSSTGNCHLSPGWPATSGTWPDGSSQTQDISGCVFFQPEAGATVTFQCGSSPATNCTPLGIETSRMYIKGFTLAPYCPSTSAPCLGGVYVTHATGRTGSADCTNALAQEVVFDGITGGADWYDNGPTDNIAYINSTFGPGWQTNTGAGLSSQVTDCLDPNSSGEYLETTRLLFAGNTMQNYVYPASTSGLHLECVHFNTGSNFVIRANRFLNCAGNPIAFQGDNNHFSPSITDGLVESNIFGDPCSDLAVTGAPVGQCSVIENGGVTVRCLLVGNTTNLTFRFNTMVRPMNFSGTAPGCTGTGFQIYGNIGTSPDSRYPSIWTSGYDLWTTWTGTLAPGDVKTSNSIDSLFTNDAAPTYDYTLSATGLSVDPLVPGTGSYLCAPTDAALAARPSTQCLAGAYQTNVNKGTGVPNPDCSPSACLAPTTAIEFTVAGQLDSAGANAKVVSQKYWIVKPTNLVCTQAKPCALVVHSGCPPNSTTNTCTTGAAHDSSGWPAQSATEKYVLMYLPPNHNCASLCAYGIPAYQPIIPPNGGPNICGSAVPPTNVCDDVPYMKAALAATICYGASPCQNIDPNAVFITGESKGAAFSFNMICDTRTSSIFRGASIVSESFPLRSTATNGSTGQTTQPNCPALGGTSNGYGGPVALNPDISIQFQYGTADATGCNIGLPATCYDTGGVTQSQDSTRWVWSNPQLAGATTGLTAGQGQTSNGSLVTPGHAIGCNGTPTSTTTVSVHLIVTDYGGCTVSLRATETVKVVNGSHACPGLQNQSDTATFSCAAYGWNFMKAH